MRFALHTRHWICSHDPYPRNVYTYKGKVLLNGFVSDAEHVWKAGKLVRDIKGVRSVTNDLHVK